jgi:hypothetical protein
MSALPIVRFARDVLGFELYPRQAAILEEMYRDGIRTAVLRLGRRSGKGRMAAVVAVFEATVNAPAHLAAVPSGERISIVVVATSQAQARIVHRYIRSFLEAPALAPLVVRDVEDEIELSSGISIVTLPCSGRSTRGQAVAVLVMDEAAWFIDSDGSPLAAEEIWQALAPATAQFPAGRVLVLSTPRWSSGWFADLCTRAASGAFPDMRAWHATTAEMNPRIPSSFLAGERDKDPDAYRREYEAEFDSGIGAVFDADLLRAAVRPGPDVKPPRSDATYVVAVDPAFTGDAFGLLVGHRDGDQVVVDLVRGWHGSRKTPVAIDPTLDEITAISEAYGRAAVVIDQFAAEAIRQGLADRGVTVLARPWSNETKIDAVAAVRRCLYAGALELPDHPTLLAELVGLEQHLLPSGRPRIAAAGGGHDDYAMSLMALVLELDENQITDEVVAWIYSLWLCQRCGHKFSFDPFRPCPKCGLPAPEQYDRPTRPRTASSD